MRAQQPPTPTRGRAGIRGGGPTFYSICRCLSLEGVAEAPPQAASASSFPPNAEAPEG